MPGNFFDKHEDDEKESKLQHLDKSENDPLKQWIVLLTVNFGFFDMFQNWLWHFHRLKLSLPIVVIAEDDKSFQKLTLLYGGTLTIDRSNNTHTGDAVDFGSQSFKNLVSERPSHILKYLKKGRNVLYCDADSVWLQDPFPFLTGDNDIWAQYDKTEYCTGFLAIKSNEKTLRFTKNWVFYMSQRTKINDQEGFNAVNKSEMRVHALDMNLFPYGQLYFTYMTKDQRENVVVVHNNWIAGHDNKVYRFKRFKLWHEEMA